MQLLQLKTKQYAVHVGALAPLEPLKVPCFSRWVYFENSLNFSVQIIYGISHNGLFPLFYALFHSVFFKCCDLPDKQVVIGLTLHSFQTCLIFTIIAKQTSKITLTHFPTQGTYEKTPLAPPPRCLHSCQILIKTSSRRLHG